MRNKKIIAFSVLLPLVILVMVGGKYSSDRYVQHRKNRYQACEGQKAERIKNHRIYEAVKAKEEEYHLQQLEAVLGKKIDKTPGTGLTGSFVPSKSSTLVEPYKNVDHPCAWLTSYYKWQSRTSASSAPYPYR